MWKDGAGTVAGSMDAAQAVARSGQQACGQQGDGQSGQLACAATAPAQAWAGSTQAAMNAARTAATMQRVRDRRVM
ncbi:MAG TPA: hypothetical protein VGT42_06230 [Gammaproteobacteria bacterium]|nr:hypothetical protein [Gammaproteobacteria bacterium]